MKADPRPSKQLAILTCMDCRLDVLDALGLELGEAHVFRNAGGLVTDDALRSLEISQRQLDTREIFVVHHTGCAAGAPDPAGAARQLRESPSLPHRDGVRGFIYETDTDTVTEIATD